MPHVNALDATNNDQMIAPGMLRFHRAFQAGQGVREQRSGLINAMGLAADMARRCQEPRDERAGGPVKSGDT